MPRFKPPTYLMLKFRNSKKRDLFVEWLALGRKANLVPRQLGWSYSSSAPCYLTLTFYSRARVRP